MNGAPRSVSLGTIVGGAFGVIRAWPVALVVWALIYFAAMAALAFAFRSGLQLPPEPGTVDPNPLASIGSSLLINLGFLVLFMTLLTAAMRSVLRPSRPGIAFLGFGMDELRQVGLCLFFLILFYVGLIVVVLVAAVIAGLLFAAAGGFGVAMMVVIGIGSAALVSLICWLAVRLSLSFPLTLLRGRFIISESWRLTRGRFWALFGGFFLIYLVVLIFSIGAASVTMADYWGALVRGGFTMRSLQTAAHAQLARQLGPIDTAMVLGWALAGIVGGIGIALQGGALATAARNLADVRGEMAETFA